MTWILAITSWLALLSGPLPGPARLAPRPSSALPRLASLSANLPGAPASRPEDCLLDHGAAIEEEEDGPEDVSVVAPPSPFAPGRSLPGLDRPRPLAPPTRPRANSAPSPLRC